MRSCCINLTQVQIDQVMRTAEMLDPELRYSFTMRVGDKLELNGQSGFVSNDLVASIIENLLAGLACEP